MSEELPRKDVIHLSSAKYLIGCLVVGLILLVIGKSHPFPSWILAVEVFLTVIALFIFGSIRYRVDKNALTYGAVFIIIATFLGGWWPDSGLKGAFNSDGFGAFLHFFKHHLLSLRGLDELIHADTMLFILGLTLFVSVIAQTRILETLSFSVLQKNKGYVVPTIGILAAVVSFSSGILDGVSMIGLMIRTLVIILLLAKASDEDIKYAVIVSTVVTTVCGMWLAYGEPPNLIMKANLYPLLNDAFFLRYCLPVAIGSYFIVLWNIRKRLKGKKVEIQKLDVLDINTADVRFLQSSRHGEVLTPVEFAEAHQSDIGSHYDAVIHRLHQGEPFGLALVKEKVPQDVRRRLIGKYVSEDLSVYLDQHYVDVDQNGHQNNDESLKKIADALNHVKQRRKQAQLIGGFSFLPFIGLLVWHAVDHTVPLFLASFAGFAIAFLGIFAIPKMWRLAMREAKHEYLEYLFLVPLFLSITLLSKSGFFDQISGLLHAAIERFGASHVAFLQFIGATFLSAILDNNVVADFAGRSLRGLEVGVLHLFAMAQIAGYAAGGCWTHIGSAQSVVAYSFIKREVDEKMTPFGWIKAMTPIILEIILLMSIVVYGEAWLLKYIPE